MVPIDDRRRHRKSLVTTALDRPSRTAAVLLGRLFYRDDLLARLAGREDLRGASDADLALGAYRHLGRAGLEGLEGEFALAVWDGERRRLWLQRDPLGSWPLYWSVRGGALIAGTGLEMVAGARGGSTLNLEAVAEYLMQPMPADELACEATFYRSVQRVRPGSLVEFGLAGEPVRHTYWDWASRIGRTQAATLNEAGDGFAERLREAVRERIPADGAFAAHLSGGLDSSSVVCLARDEVAARTAPAPFHTLSLAYRRRSLAGERSFIDMIVRQGGPLEPHVIEGDEILYYDWFRGEFPRLDEPSGLMAAMSFHGALVDAADRLDAVVTMSGEGSDEIAYFMPYHLADRVRCGRWLSALSEAGRWSSARNRGLMSFLNQYVWEPLCPILSREGVGPYLRGGYGTWPRLGFFSVPPWVRPDFAQRQRLFRRGRSNAREMFGSPTAVSWQRFMFRTISGDWLRWHLAAPLGLDFTHPFNDPRLVLYTLGLPRDLRSAPGQSKPILQAAMRDVLPPPLLNKRCSPGFDDLYGLGLRENLPRLERLVRAPSSSELGIIDPEVLIPALHQAAMGIGDARANDRLMKALTLLAWFDHVSRRGPAVVTAEVVAWDGREAVAAGRLLP
jgi:asparagine synthase (glutamine-hydrolysing)